MYYLKIRDEDGGNTLNYYCRNCGHEDTTLTAETICVSETQLRRSEQKYTHMVNEYTKFDPTLPRINTIKCPNQECTSNGGHSGTTMHGSAMHGGVSDTTEVTETSANYMFPGKKPEYDGGAGTSKAGTSKADASKADTSKADASKADASKAGTSKAETKRNKTAKTLAKEAAESAKESAKEALASAKKAETIFKELDKEVEAEEAQSIKKGIKSKSAVAKSKKDGSEREVIYIRYDDINMKYVYLCVHCDTTWKTDNRM
jgi:rubrerythrin